jgi:Flp pilus assembly protein TadB
MTFENRSFSALVTDFARDISRLVRSEFALARAEIVESLERVNQSGMLMMVGGLIAFSALLTLVQALVVLLAKFMAPWLASVVVGVALAIVSFVMLEYGRKLMHPANLMPRRAAGQAEAGSEMVKDKI